MNRTKSCGVSPPAPVRAPRERVWTGRVEYREEKVGITREEKLDVGGQGIWNTAGEGSLLENGLSVSGYEGERPRLGR